VDGAGLGIIAYSWRVALVFAILLGAMYALRRWGGTMTGIKTPRGDMRVVETLPLAPQRSLFIVEVDGRRFLIGATPHSFTFLTELEAHPQRAPKEDQTH